MRTMQRLAVAIMAVLAATAASAGQSGDSGSGWVTELLMQRIEDGFLERPETAQPSPQREGSWMTFARTNEMPADVAARPFIHQSFVAVDVAANGHATGCRPLRASSEPRLDALACRLLMRPEYFSAYLIPIEPSPAPTRWAISVRFETMEAAESARRREVFALLMSPTRRQASPPPMRVARLASEAPAPAICPIRPFWGFHDAANRRVSNWVGVGRDGGLTWNGVSISRETLDRYVAITRTMSPRPLVVLERLPGASCEDLESIGQWIEANHDCRSDGCQVGSRPDRPSVAPPPPRPVNRP